MKNNNKKIKVAVLIPITSKNQKWKEIGEIDFINVFLPSFLRTREEDKFEYKFFLGVDSDDKFFVNQIEILKNRLRQQDRIYIKNFSGNPCGYWNFLLQQAYNEGFEYFQQFGDDIEIISKNWTSFYVNTLKKNNDFGVIGGCDTNFWIERMMNNEIGIVENCMISRKHYEILKFFFHPNFKTWFSDDWISQIYHNICFTVPEIKFINKNRVGDHNPRSRYNYNMEDKKLLNSSVLESQEKIYKYIIKNKLITSINKDYFNYLHKKFKKN